MILFHPNLNFKIEKQITDRNGSYIILDEMCADTRLVLVNIYAPNDALNKSCILKNYNINLKTMQKKQ